LNICRRQWRSIADGRYELSRLPDELSGATGMPEMRRLAINNATRETVRISSAIAFVALATVYPALRAEPHIWLPATQTA
jgi:hypothetical protein